MKIVRIIARLNVGGPAKHVAWLSSALNDDEFKTTLITGTVPDSEGDMGYFAEQLGVKPFIIPEMSRELSYRDAISLWKTFRKLQIEEPDIIHTHTAKAGTIGRIAGFLYRLTSSKKPKLIHTFHGHVFHSYYGKHKTTLFLLIERLLAKFATDTIIVISEQQRREINEEFRIGSRDQFKVIPLGIDLSVFENAESRRENLRGELQIADDVILVGIVGRITEIKNHALFLRVVKLYEQRKIESDSPLRFVVIGDGNLREELERTAKTLGISHLVNFLGERADLENIYPSLDILALTSNNEGTPLSIIEAMANSRPVISTAVGGVVDLIGVENSRRGDFAIHERGIGVDAENAKGFFEGLMFLAGDPDLRRNLGQKGRDFIVNSYSKERLISDIKALYTKLLNETSARV